MLKLVAAAYMATQCESVAVFNQMHAGAHFAYSDQVGQDMGMLKKSNTMQDARIKVLQQPDVLPQRVDKQAETIVETVQPHITSTA